MLPKLNLSQISVRDESLLLPSEILKEEKSIDIQEDSHYFSVKKEKSNMKVKKHFGRVTTDRDSSRNEKM